MTLFDRERAREAGKKGALVRWAKPRPGEPLGGTIVDLAAMLGDFQGPSWTRWWAFLKALFALPLGDEELAAFREFTGRAVAPVVPAREAWVIAGRRGGKSAVAALVAAYLAACRDYRGVLRSGERGVVMCVAGDRKQAGIVLRYIKALFAHPLLAPLVARPLRDALELASGIALEVATCSFKSTRGYTVVGAVLDETAFWPTDDSASPDTEVLAAIRPAALTVPGAVLLAISTPYSRRGELFRMFERHYGRSDAPVLVWKAPTRAMNPTVPLADIQAEEERDPVRASAEYGAEFRRDVEAFLTLEAVQAVTEPGRLELPPRAGTSYVAFADPAGGSGEDSFTLAVAHREGDVAVLDCLREVKPDFSPTSVVAEFAALLKTYHVADVVGDAYAAEWSREAFRKEGVSYTPSERVRSDLYRELLPLVNGRRCALLDHPRLLAQLVSLERRVARSGKDAIDHGPKGHDDVANSAAGALLLAAGGAGGWEEFMRHFDPHGGPLHDDSCRVCFPVAGGASATEQTAVPQPAATRTRLSRLETSQRCQCGATYGIGDQIVSCPACGRPFTSTGDPPAPAHLPPLTGQRS